MALNAADFYPLGPIRSADIKQFVDLLTGVMTDQPVTLKNTLTVGSSQGAANAPLKLYGATGQTSDLIDLYPDPTSANPTFGFGASGRFGWGAGGTAVPDTFLSRIGTQNGHVTDTAGLFIQPNLEISGTLILDGPLSFQAGGDLKNFSGNTLELDTNLVLPGHLWFDTGLTAGITELAGLLALDPTVLVHQANAQGNGLTYGNARLQVRSNDIDGTTTGAQTMGFSAQAWSGNWLQFNARFYNLGANGGWPQMALGLCFDVDNSPGVGGQIWMANTRVGIAGLPNVSGDTLQVMGNATINGDLNASGHLSTSNGNLYVGSQHVYDGGSNRLWLASDINIVGGNIYLGGSQHIQGLSDGTHFFWDIRINGQHDVFTHTVHLQQSDGVDCRIDTVGDMNYWGPNGSTNHRFHHVDGSWMGCQAANFVPQSDARFKKDLQVMSDADALERLRLPVPVMTWQPDWQPQRAVGFTAQDMQPVVPEVVQTDAEGSMFLNYDFLTAVLWGALRALDQRCQAKGI